jgi:hypothetical protein
MIVGTTALPMTTASSSEYCPLSMMPWVSPKRAEIDPKVSTMAPVPERNLIHG